MLRLIQAYQKKNQLQSDNGDECYMWIDRNEKNSLRKRCQGVDNNGKPCHNIVTDEDLLCIKHANQRIAYFNA